MKRKIFLVLTFGVFIASMSIFGQAKAADSEPNYFFAYENMHEGWIEIRLDGEFFFSDFNKAGEKDSKDKYGTRISSPGERFEKLYTQIRSGENPACKFGEKCGKNQRYVTVQCDEGGIKDIVGVAIGEDFTVIRPSPDGKGKRKLIKVRDFIYQDNHDEPIAKSYLMARSQPLDDLEEHAGELVAIRGDWTAGGGIQGDDPPIVMPEPVKEEYERFLGLKDKWQAGSDSYIQDDFVAGIQPVLINTRKIHGEMRFVMNAFLRHMEFTPEFIYLSREGYHLYGFIHPGRGVLTGCAGVVRAAGPYGAEDMLVYDNQVGKYACGSSLFKYDEDGVYREILFLLTYWD